MKFSCDKNEFMSACAIAARAAAPKSPIVSLEGLLIQAGENIRITGFDLKKGIYTRIPADIEQRGESVFPAKLFGEIIRRMPDGIVNVSVDENENVNIRCGKNEYSFIAMSAEEYPEMPDVDIVNSVSIPQNILSEMINKTIFAVATNDIRPVYSGILFEVEDDTLTLVAVDGFRLAKRTEKIENGVMENCSFIVPGSALNDVIKICGEEGSVNISVGSKHVCFTIGDTVVVTRRLEGEFLNYKKAIPNSFKHEITVNRSAFITSVDRVSVIISEKNSGPVRISFKDNLIGCKSYSTIGKAEDECDCEGTGEGIEIGFNDKYLTDALKAASGSEKLKLCINTASSPFIIKAEDGSEGFIYMVLPVRLRAGE